jgi:hypothetical protein
LEHHAMLHRNAAAHRTDAINDGTGAAFVATVAGQAVRWL